MNLDIRSYLLSQANARTIAVPEGHTLALKVLADYQGRSQDLDTVKAEVVSTLIDSRNKAADIRAEIRQETASLQSDLKTEMQVQKGCKRLLGIKAKTRN